MKWLDRLAKKLVQEEPVTEVEIKEVEESLEDQKLIEEIEEAATTTETKNGLIQFNFCDGDCDEPEPEFRELLDLTRSVALVPKATKVKIFIASKVRNGQERNYVRFSFDGDPFDGEQYVSVYLSGRTIVLERAEKKMDYVWCYKFDRRSNAVSFVTEDAAILSFCDKFVKADKNGFYTHTEYDLTQISSEMTIITRGK